MTESVHDELAQSWFTQRFEAQSPATVHFWLFRQRAVQLPPQSMSLSETSLAPLLQLSAHNPIAAMQRLVWQSA